MVCWPFLVQALYWVHSLSLLCMADCLAYFLCREWLWAPQGPHLALAGISRMCLKMLLCSLVDNLVISVQEISINNSYQFIFHLTEGPAVRPSAEGLCWSAGLCLQGTAHRFYHAHFISDTFRESPHSVAAFFKDPDFQWCRQQEDFVILTAYLRSREMILLHILLPTVLVCYCHQPLAGPSGTQLSVSETHISPSSSGIPQQGAVFACSWPVMVLLVLWLYSGSVSELVFGLHISILISFSLFKPWYSGLCSSVFRQLFSSSLLSSPTAVSGGIMQSSQIVQWWFTLWLWLSFQLSSPFLGLTVILHWRPAIFAYLSHFQLH